MPCTHDDYPGRSHSSCDHSAMIAENKHLALQAEVATRVACQILTRLEPVQISNLPREAQDWWKRHQQADLERQAIEAVAAAARRRAKATERERRFQDALSIAGELTPAQRKALKDQL